MGEIEIAQNIGDRVVISVLAYIIVLALLIAIIVLSIIDKLKKTKTVLIALAIVFLAYSGFVLMSIPRILFDGLEGSLGFLATFINLPEMLQASLGIGYWVTMISLICLLSERLAFHLEAMVIKK